MNLKLLWFGIVLLMSAVALAAPANVGFIVPTPVIYDVPFTVGVTVDAGATPFTEFDLSARSNSAALRFTAHSPNMFTVHGSTGPYTGGYRYYTTATGETKLSTGQLFTLATNVEAVVAAPITIGIDATKTNTITPSIGYDALVVAGIDSAPFTPTISACGDGVVGYFDTDSDGIKDGTETDEACDDGMPHGGRGCDNCRYIYKGFKGSNCAFGSRNCVVTKLKPNEYLKERLNALLEGKCYPAVDHPQAEFCGEDTFRYSGEGKLENSQRPRFLAALGVILKDFLREGILPRAPG